MKKAVFLDRDGVITIPEFRDGRSYAPKTLKEFQIYPDSYEALSLLKKEDYLLIIVTNQPDMGKGLLSQEILKEMNTILLSQLPIDLIKICPHLSIDNCFCRKPHPGMLIEASQELDVDLSKSFMVGDRDSDVIAGRSATCSTIFVDLNYTAETKPTVQDLSLIHI